MLRIPQNPINYENLLYYGSALFQENDWLLDISSIYIASLFKSSVS